MKLHALILRQNCRSRRIFIIKLSHFQTLVKREKEKKNRQTALLLFAE